MIKKLKDRWGVNTVFDLMVIFFVFAITGTTSVYIRRYMFDVLGIGDEINLWLRALLYIVIIFPTYQVLLVFYGFVFGQFKFFWKMEKRILKRMGINFF